ncbi:hypothetical protein HY031_02380 [Candidatus Gottesmanbacteria bacterium]|nr:hypothetical protein [Candidatus Gottesmanbacteria bacterium]
MKLIVLGSSAVFPLPRTKTNRFEDYSFSDYERRFPLHDDPVCNAAKAGGKDRRMRPSLAVVVNRGTILVDAGPDVREQLARYHVSPTAIVITHEHADAVTGLPFMRDTSVYREKDGTLKPGIPLELFGILVTPFRVTHAVNTPTVGFRFDQAGKSFAYISDMASIRGIEKWVRDTDILFADGSILEKHTHGHMAIVRQLVYFKKWRLKRVVFTHIGHATLPHAELTRYLKTIYPPTDVAYDGMEITL